MFRKIGVSLVLLTVTAGVVVFGLNWLSKPVASQAATITPFMASDSAPIQNFNYNGKHSDWVRKLLTRVGGWRCPASASDSGAPPSVKADECMRDKYVAAAVLYAWAAECYARNEEDSKATQAAEGMYEQLKNAQELCSDAPSFGFGTRRECDTVSIYKCGEL